MTMLELVIATALMSTVMAAVAVLLRNSYATWREHSDDVARIEAAHATLRHLVRQIRQADSVVSITAANNTVGALSVLLPSGATVQWQRNSGTNQVQYGVSPSLSLLAENITELSFTGYAIDGTTATTTVADIHSIECRVKVLLDDSDGARQFASRAWIRSW